MENNNTALEGVKKMIADGIVTQEAAEKYFPELKKSKDERTQLTEFLWDLIYKGSSFRYHREDFERWKAWLDKQGEQKTDDKVEPKFHKGDWVVDKDGRIYQITHIGKDNNSITYACSLIENPMFWFLYYEDEIRKWDITKDAKDGDVLVTGEVIFIFKKIHDGWIYCHCSIHNDGSFIAEDYGLITYKYSGEVHPATKEQRDVLFSKMKEAGYEWDTVKDNADNLLKIAVKKFNAVQDDSIQINPSEYINDIGGNGCYLKNTTKTSTWDEGDDSILQKVVESVTYYWYGDTQRTILDWLSFLKERVLSQPKQEWSDEDEDMLDNIIDDYNDADEHNLVDDIGKVMWLKSLKERVGCEANCTTTKQWKPSEQDILLLERIANGKSNPQDFQASLGALIEQLKKLRKK